MEPSKTEKELSEYERIANYTVQSLHPAQSAIFELCAEVRKLKEENLRLRGQVRKLCNSVVYDD